MISASNDHLLVKTIDPNANLVASYIQESINCLNLTLHDESFINSILQLSSKIIDILSSGGKILIAGNGGSAADAQHFAAELVSRFLVDSKPYAAVSLTTDTSALTAISNDYGYEYVFSRQLQALASENDLFVAITTSGKSPNILEGLKMAQKLNMSVCSFTGSQGLSDPTLSQLNIKAVSTSTPQIQEVHTMAIHLVCALVESNLSSIS